jgi:hypothetical protein
LYAYKVKKGNQISLIGNDCMLGIAFFKLQVVSKGLDDGMGHKKTIAAK